MTDSKPTDMQKPRDSANVGDDERVRVRRSISRFEQATLHNVDLKSVVKAANGVPHDAWVAMKFRDVLDDLHAVVSMMQQQNDVEVPPLCTKKTCCEAKVFRHIWAVGPNREKQQVSPPEYISLLMDWVRNVTSRKDVKLSMSDTKRITNRLVRIYVHYYQCHGKQFDQSDYEIAAHMNYCFKHFLYFAEEYDFLKEEELEPIRPIVDELMRKNGAPHVKTRSFDPPGRTPREQAKGDKEKKPAAPREDLNLPQANLPLRKEPKGQRVVD